LLGWRYLKRRQGHARAKTEKEAGSCEKKIYKKQ
jgi:hypothetical protein